MAEASVVLGNACISVGRLIFETDGRRSHSTFIYDERWLENPIGFDLAPDIPRSRPPFHFSAEGRESRRRDVLAGPFTDTSPDSWGRKLIRRVHGEGATEFDYLVAADDKARHGALRFFNEKGELFHPDQPPVPRLANIEELRAIAARYERDPEGAEAEARDLVGAAGSLGGARPKANVEDGEDLWIAKFTSVDDTWPVERLEIATLEMARMAGIRTPEARLELAASQHPVGLIKRFDRRKDGRLPYMSARTALGKKGSAHGYYTDIADVLRQMSVLPERDIRELWQRLLFTVLITNTDDHLKNHGLLYVRDNRWRLSPMFDVNPQPRRQPTLETGISDVHGFEPSVEAVIDAAPFFDIAEPDARDMAKNMANTIATIWTETLRQHGITGAALKRCAPAFEHERMETALAL
ncbi:type II toxin-antitoxin system HipA family toxin [uncultured Litoreibacter sp.]|uniref:type II toxin-antitoxin system HipA family toxin n=1 Tax=uncultured Litoreibacter sp. TaxID=1392394 RepID=UPI00261BFA03|nr:type II toxin-antitoxin system HipA family toxin [uncultured Litoreibacter sp.]